MYPRLVKSRIEETLEDTRVVLLVGPRQSGKTTLAEEIARKSDMAFMSLDDPNQFEAATSDPVGFLRGVDRVVIDEIQRAPELMLGIKREVDRDRRPGRFLLTGSTDMRTLPKAADSLAGRMEVLQLLPLSQAEIRGGKGRFLDDAFSGKSMAVGGPSLGKDLVDLALAGGYPEALARDRWSRRRSWHVNYVDAVVRRDMPDIANIAQPGRMRKLLDVLAEHSGQPANSSAIGSALGMNHVTTLKYIRALENLHLIRLLEPWFTSRLKRLAKSPKLHFLDSGLLSALAEISPERIAKDRTAFGAILESFVVGEVLKIASWSDQRRSCFHFRDKGGAEVDLVVENARGEVVGIEIKASATIRGADFSGLKKLASACGDKFVLGMVLYDHDQVVPYGEKLRAVPLACLWA